MKKFHILNDLGFSKNSIKKQIAEHMHYMGNSPEADERGLTKANDLISIRTQMSTGDEFECMVAWYFTSHDECVLDNQEDYSPVEVYQSKQKMYRYESAINLIKKLN
jgi:hypothetical protein